MPERGGLLGVPVDPFLHRADVHKGHGVLAGQQRGTAGQVRQQQPAHLLHLQHVPSGESAQGRAQRGRRPDPARQCRQRAVPQQPMSSMLSAPAIIPAARQGIFRCAFTPHGCPIRTCSVTRSPSPARCARAISGTRPLCDTRCGSSKVACVFARSCNNRTCEVSFRPGNVEASGTPIVPAQRHLSRLTRPNEPPFTRWIEAKVRRVHLGRDMPEPLYLQLAAILRGQIQRRELTGRIPKVKLPPSNTGPPPVPLSGPSPYSGYR